MPSRWMFSPGSGFDERQWVIQIRRTLDEELDEEEFGTPVSIFSVPKTLLATDPDSYVPHQLPIGPYHCWRPEMYEMARYKLSAAKRFQKNLRNLKFEDAVLQLARHELQIRCCYHNSLTCNGETLSWMMAVDACFMLEFLQVYAPRDGESLHRVSSRMLHLVDVTGRKLAHNAILRDITMLENQIPLFVLRKMLESKFSSLEKADNNLFEMLMGLFNVLSPFKTMEELPEVEAMWCAHLLDFLYRLIVPKLAQPPEKAGSVRESTCEGARGERGDCWQNSIRVGQILEEAWKIISQWNNRPVRIIKNIFCSKLVVFLSKVPWTIFSNVKENENPEGEKHSINDDKPPLVEEIAIPSVSELSRACVNFVPTKSGIQGIMFDEKTRSFHLPPISLDENSCVVLKNLVAYEACNASGPVMFTRYTELMNGIIDTEEDVRLLREKGIILNRLKSDEEVAKLWNGMTTSVRLTKAPLLDKVIADVNKFYNARWKVKLGKLLKAYVFGSWKLLTLLACVLLLLLMAFQAFCFVYNCGRKFQYFQVQN